MTTRKRRALPVLAPVALVVLFVSLAFVAGRAPARADSDPASELSSYIVLMEGAPALRYEGDLPGLEATRPSGGRGFQSAAVSVVEYREHLVSSHAASLNAAGAPATARVHDYTVALNGYSAILTAEQAERIAGQPGVISVRRDDLRFPQTDSSPDFLGLTAPGGPWSRDVLGEGVVVGVIDTGIWPEHPSFADDGSYGAPPVTLSDTPFPNCDFGNTAHNPTDAPFTCNNKLVGARQMLATYRALIGADSDEYDSARDDGGHGTGMASIAAGNDGVAASVFGIPRGLVSGVAPRAHVVAYKALGNLGGFTSDLAAAIDQAVADGVDVILYGIGGGASLSGADEIAMLFAADAGVHVAASAGNSGPGGNSIVGPGSTPWLTAVGASTQTRFLGGVVSSSDGWQYLGASITPGTSELPLVDAEFAGGDLCLPGTLLPGMVAGKIVLCRQGGTGRVQKSLEVLTAGGAGMILYDNDDLGDPLADNHWVPSVLVNNTAGLAIKAYIATDPSPTARITSGATLGGIATDPPIGPAPKPAPSTASFSSRGPNPVAPDIIKPDVTAPGVQILAGHTPTPDPGAVPGNLFQAISGTSASAAHVAGVYALLAETHPDWTPAMAKSALMTTAYQAVFDRDGVTPADPFDMGAGHIDPGSWSRGSVARPGLVYDAGFLEYLGFLCDEDPSVFSDPTATCTTLASIGIPVEAPDLNLASIAMADVFGSHTVRRTVTSVVQSNGPKTFEVSVDAPPGFDVTVSPSSIRLRRGESATYEVTFTDVSGTPGVWSFGSLTWSDRQGNYSVRSPIAVRPVP